MNTFSYADKMDALHADISSYASQIKYLQENHQLLLSRHNELRDSVYELTSEVDKLRSFIVNDPDSPFVVKFPDAKPRKKKKQDKKGKQ